MNRFLLLSGAFVAATALLALPASAQSELPDPDCEDDPLQAGCDPACESPDVDCRHPPCPTDLAAQALPDGSVFMTWTLNSYSDVRIERSEAGGPFQEIAYLEFPDTRGLDQETEAGVTYEYRVIAVGMHQYNDTIEATGESQGCQTIEVTTVPVFPSALAGGAAVAAAAVGYVVMRRR